MGIIHLEINLDGDDYKAADGAREGRIFLILVVIFSPQPEPPRSAELAGHKDTSAVHHDKPNRLPPLKKKKHHSGCWSKSYSCCCIFFTLHDCRVGVKICAGEGERGTKNKKNKKMTGAAERIPRTTAARRSSQAPVWGEILRQKGSNFTLKTFGVVMLWASS